ncbi:putative quinol monooxygenase [Schaalia sp. Marseille-Q2122]|uniref:putative quinol monooxygenase n=1 Tax=Schaalia sp. Marseille-Q2122 TaxID=2736604 RepID=UPI00158F3132|nr:antibiotic biosynthesis monooxygenase [Schaalia sp. Marseille-Q2122]
MNTPYIALSGILSCKDERELGLVQAFLPAHIEFTRAEEGCISFEVTQDSVNPLIWHVNELFDSQASFDAHQRRTLASEWGAQTAHIKREYIVSEIAAQENAREYGRKEQIQ